MEYSNSQINEIIAEYVHNEKFRQILCRRLIDGITLERLAEEFDMSISQIKRIIRRESAAVFRHVPV